MRKIYIKLTAVTLTLVFSVVVMVMSTYAWLVLAGNPEVTGMQVTIGGNNTVLIAPDIVKVVDGKTYHIPGDFTSTMQFNKQDSYEYLNSVGGLTPVSTSDGVRWFLPAYYDQTDPEVRDGSVYSGQLKDVSAFTIDDELLYANLPAEQKEKIARGSYVYMDFWVVSHGGDYDLRVSTGDDTGGSFVVDMMQPEKDDSYAGYALVENDHKAAAAVRVGFLANPVRTDSETYLAYQNSRYFQSRYTSLQGFYLEPDSGSAEIAGSRFTIYEPNCDLHPTDAAEDGSYVVTNPLGLQNGNIVPVSVVDRVTAQKTSSWTKAENGSGTALAQRFQSAIIGKDLDGMNLQQVGDYFYSSYLQGQYTAYVQKGSFIKKTADLYKFTDTITAGQLSGIEHAGATDDVYIISLERYVPQRIRMFIWLEGQDVDCVNSVAASAFAVNIELAGGNK